jgi:phosphatidylglycerol---prolipoprotein diacylglyceryl transferase
MHPTIVDIGPLPLHSYGLLLALSFFFGILLAAKRAPSRGLHPDLVYDTSLVIVFAAIIGARILYVLFHMQDMHSWVDVVAVWGGGLTMYGGVLGALAASWFYLRRRHVPFLRMADVVAPSLGLGLGLTRVGCFLNGCCYGKPTTSIFGVHFPPDSFVSGLFGGAAVHPTQLYSSLTGFAIMAILLLVDRRRLPEGRLFALWLVMDAAGRFVLDFFRYYEANVYVAGGLTVNQIIGIGLMLVGVLLFVRTSRRAPAPAPAPATPPDEPGEALPVSNAR